MTRTFARLSLTALTGLTLIVWLLIDPAISAKASSGGRMVFSPGDKADASLAAGAKTMTSIKHLVVIFQENVSFDHYFATYPHAANPPGGPQFTAAPNTPQANTLESAGLLAPNNPNSVQPFRLDRTQALTCDQNHEYTAEQQAVDGGKMDKFVQFTDAGGSGNSRQFCPTGVVMGYYDGNTTTALWNYAQHFAMNDNSYGTVFGPSTPGVLNLVAGDTAGVACGPSSSVYLASACSPTSSPSGSSGTVYGDPDQYYDDWSSGGYGSKNTSALTIPNIGDALNAKGLTWGWFNGGFDVNTRHPAIAVDQYLGINPSTDTTTSLTDYSAHHEGFQYFASTSNPHHLLPSSASMIGRTDVANHQYDTNDFFTAADSGNLPSVSYLKAPRYQDGHPGYSDPLDEQQFVVDTVNHLMLLPSWKSTAIVIQYDDSDGWYDHVAPPQVNRSNTPLDAGCGNANDGAPARCGYGPRLPFILISPYARQNYTDHTLTDQTTSLRFIEDNWLGSNRMSAESFDNKAGTMLNMFDWSPRFNPPNGRVWSRLLLNPTTGEPQ